MHTAPSLGKRPIKVQHYYKNLKFFVCFLFCFFGGWGGGGVSLFIFFLAGFTRSYEKSSIKIHSIENIFVRGPSDNLSGGVYVCTFQPGNCEEFKQQVAICISNAKRSQLQALVQRWICNGRVWFSQYRLLPELRTNVCQILYITSLPATIFTLH